MSVVRTDLWLKEDDTSIDWCQRLEPYFPDADAEQIHNHLYNHGLYMTGRSQEEPSYRLSLKKHIWNIVKVEEKKLKQEWNVPDVPIFILPVDVTNHRLLQEFNGKSGVSYHDKLFLFVSHDLNDKDIRALFTHEYNHVARLNHHYKPEDELCLLDSVVMEGLAENAVRERLGEDHTAKWTEYYNDRQLERMWHKLIMPHQDLKPSNALHDCILYGQQFYPYMAGYASGYHIVEAYLHKKVEISWTELLITASETIAGL